MGMNSLWKTVVPLGLLAGCSPQAAPAPPPQPPEKTVFDPLLQQERRARDVQKTVSEEADRTRQAIDEPERGDKSSGDKTP